MGRGLFRCITWIDFPLGFVSSCAWLSRWRNSLAESRRAVECHERGRVPPFLFFFFFFVFLRAVDRGVYSGPTSFSFPGCSTILFVLCAAIRERGSSPLFPCLKSFAVAPGVKLTNQTTGGWLGASYPDLAHPAPRAWFALFGA